MFKKRAFLTIYRGLLRQARQIQPDDSLIIRKPVDTESYRRAPYSWAETADGALSLLSKRLDCSCRGLYVH